MAQDSGWNLVAPGATLFAFDEVFKDNPSGILREDRVYAQTNSQVDDVSGWRSSKPIFNKDFCINCQYCWVYCPDMSIIPLDKKFGHIDYSHCKGCGICVEVCPTNPKSLLMFDESAKEEDCINQWPQKEKKS